jgi:hypothetical protein
MFKGKKQAQFTVQFEGGRMRDGLMHYRPGEEINFSIEIIPEEDISFRSLTIGIAWHTEGKGDRDEEVVDSVVTRDGVLTGGVPLSDNFSFTLPDRPWSYAGELVNIIWTVKIAVDIPKARDIVHEEPFVMAPGPDQVRLEEPPVDNWSS